MNDIILKRLPDGRPSFKGVQHIVIRHSPTGMEWGYAGSGPADLALNILNAAKIPEAERDALYQDFKFAFVTSEPKTGGVIKGETILEWIEKMRDLKARKEAEQAGSEP